MFYFFYTCLFKLLTVVFAVLCVTAGKDLSAKAVVRKLPEGLQFGAATASFQVEGGWNAADKSPSIWDTFCEIPGKIKDGTDGRDTCKSYEYYQRDIEMLKFLGVDFYRFSVSWPRVLPSGFADKISQDGIGYYSRLVDELLANGIEPVVTLYHWDLPQSLQNLGGWANPLIADWFEDYARVLYDALGDRVKLWLTLNEPKQFAIYGYGNDILAPNINSHGIGDYMAVKNLLLAHARAWHLYDKEYRQKQNGSCGITIASDFCEGASDSPADVEAGNLALDFEIGFYSHPIFSSTGGFPDSIVKRVAERSATQGFPRSRLPVLTKEEIEFIRGTSDFYGFNHYSTRFYTAEGYKSGMFDVPSYDDDVGAVSDRGEYTTAPNGYTTIMGRKKGTHYECIAKRKRKPNVGLIRARQILKERKLNQQATVSFPEHKIPAGIRKALNWIKDSYNNPEIMIFENGYGDFGGVNDLYRIDYYKSYLDAILDAIEMDGCRITKYTAWSLMDNFEWSQGFSVKYGLFEVDYEDEKRTRRAKTSAIWYRNLIANRILDPADNPKLEKIEF